MGVGVARGHPTQYRYNALSTCRGGPTFALAFHRFWNRGYDAYKKAD